MSDGSHASDDTPDLALDGLPGGALIEAGRAELRRGSAVSAEALLVAIARPKLRQLGLEIPGTGPVDPEQALYDLLARENADTAHGRYNALRREAVSFARAYAVWARRRA